MNTKRIFLFFAAFLLIGSVFSQKKAKFTEEDAKQFYRTIQGDYSAKINDSTTVALHFTPIWEQRGNRFQWLYMEAVNPETKEILVQKVLEIKPISSKTFKVFVHGLKNPAAFAGKWGNRNYFDGFTTTILKGKCRYIFTKTKDFEYQTSWNGRKDLKCFPSGDRIHFKFVQADERFYIKRLPNKSTHIIGYIFMKDLTDDKG